jgi:hypothetical protein
MIPGGNPAGCQNCRDLIAAYLNYPFELLGSLSGGRRFEAQYHGPPAEPDKPARLGGLWNEPPPVFYERPGKRGHLGKSQEACLGRFRATYTIGFVPSVSSETRPHKLEVKLAKSAGQVTEGKRIAKY